jgi:hypothetical protein
LNTTAPLFDGSRHLLAALSLALAHLTTIVAWAGPAEDYAESIRPLLEKKCFECHGPEKKKGDLDLATFADYASVTNALEVWQTVNERVVAFEMPPKKAAELNYGEHQKFVKWLRELPKPAHADCDQLASDRTASFYRGYVMSRRLNRAEYSNTVRDLFGIELNVASLLPADGGGGEGFDTSGNALFLSPIHIEKYLQAADQIAQAVLPDSTRGVSKEQLAARQRLLRARPGMFKPARDAARQTLAAIARRAYRRGVQAEDVDLLLTAFERGWARGDGYVRSLRLALKAMLISPHFLFLAEPEPEQGGVHRLAAVPLASKLSYFLWSSMPDDELLALGASGRLHDPELYLQQVRRMLADPRAAALGERFTLQWLDLERLGNEVRPDAERFPEFDAALAVSMRREVTAFVQSILSENRPLLELIDSEEVFVDGRLAALYGVPGVNGTTIRRVQRPNPNRGGVLGMAAVHAMTSYPLRTSPVLRGKWVLDSFLGDRVSPPPPDTPLLEEDPKKISHVSLREQLEAHRAKAECAACHDRMDPLGFGLENFDVLGRWRDTDRGQPINAQGTLPSGETFSGPAGLKRVLQNRRDDMVRHVARKLTGYAFGRELNKFDDCVIDRAMQALKANEYRAWVLIEHITVSFPFQHRFYPKQDS